MCNASPVTYGDSAGPIFSRQNAQRIAVHAWRSGGSIPFSTKNQLIE
jgi:hypothetical protein